MGKAIELLRRRAFIAFYILAWLIPLVVFALLYGWTTPLELINGGSFDAATLIPDALDATGYSDVDLISLFPMMWYAPATIVVVLYAASPSIAALLVATVAWGRSGLVRLVSRLNPLHGGWVASRDAYVLLLAGMCLVSCLGLALSELVGKGAEVALANMATASFFGLWGWLAYATLFDEGGSLEELGWRGFGQPLLTERLASPLSAAILLGTLWSLWHLPIRLTSPYIMNANLHWALYLAVLWASEVGVSITAAYFLNRSGGSVWPAIMIHGFSNNMTSTFAFLERPGLPGVNVVADGLIFRVGVSIAVGCLLVLVAGRNLGLTTAGQGGIADEASGNA